MFGHEGTALFRRIRRHGLLERSVSLGMGFRSPNEAQRHSLFLLPENLDAELSVPSPAPWLPLCAMLPDMITKD